MISHMAGKTLYQKKSVNITLDAYTIRLMHGMLWVGQYNQITVYDQNLLHVRDISCNDMGWINGVVDAGSGGVVTADTGLYMLHNNGEQTITVFLFI